MVTVSPGLNAVVSAPVAFRTTGTTFRMAGTIFQAVRPKAGETAEPRFPFPSLAEAENRKTPVGVCQSGKKAARQKW